MRGRRYALARTSFFASAGTTRRKKKQPHPCPPTGRIKEYHFTSIKLPYVNAVDKSECASPNSADAIEVQKD
jgi:hypothetical protein